MNANQHTQGLDVVAAVADRPCPNCGHCPTCGRSNALPYFVPYPSYPVYPTYPWNPLYPTWINGGVTYQSVDLTNSTVAAPSVYTVGLNA